MADLHMKSPTSSAENPPTSENFPDSPSTEPSIESSNNEVPPRPEVQAAIQQVNDFCANALPGIPDDARETAAHSLAQSLPPGLTSEELTDINYALEEAIHAHCPPLYAHGKTTLRGWDKGFPFPKGLEGFGECLTRMRNFASEVFPTLQSLDSIVDAFEAFLPSILPYPMEMESRVYSEFIDHFSPPSDWGPDREQAETLVMAYIKQDYGNGFSQDQLHPDMWRRIRRSRPNLHFYNGCHEDDWAPPAIPDWFVPRFTVEPPYCREARTGASPLLIELIDQINIKAILHDMVHSMIIMVTTMFQNHSEEKRAAESLLRQSDTELWCLFQGVECDKLYTDHDQGSQAVQELINKADTCFTEVRQRIAEVEHFLVTVELLDLTTTAEDAISAKCSRFERAKLRFFFQQTINKLKTQRLKQSDYSAGILRRNKAVADVVAIPRRTWQQEDHMCGICHEDFVGPQQEDVVVTHTCCKKPFHVDCLGDWLADQLWLQKEDLLCPWCRQGTDEIFFAELLAVKTRQFDTL